MLCLFIVLSVCFLPMRSALQPRLFTEHMERLTVASSMETWRRAHGLVETSSEVVPMRTPVAGEQPPLWMFPVYNGEPRVHKPPLTSWLTMLAWSDLDPSVMVNDRSGATVQLFLKRARIVAIIMAMLCLAGIYWVGILLGGVRAAIIASLATGTTFFFIFNGAIASYDVHLAAWSTLAFAAALHAMKPLGAPAARGRYFFGWILTGVFLSFAVLSKGPIAVLWTALPIAAAVLVNVRGAQFGKRLINSIGGLVMAIIVATAIALPWYVMMLSRFAAAGDRLEYEYTNVFMRAPLSPLPSVWTLLFSVPWTLWAIAGIVAVFLRVSPRRSRRRALIAMLWLLAGVGALSIPGLIRAQRYLFPVFPAVGLLVGMCVIAHRNIVRRGKSIPHLNLLRLSHWGAIMLASLTVLGWKIFEPMLIARGVIDQPFLANESGWLVALMTVVLLVVAAFGARAHWRNKPFDATLITGIWACVFFSLLFDAYARSGFVDEPIAPTAARLDAITHDQPLVYVRTQPGAWINDKLLLLLQRSIPQVEFDELNMRTAKYLDKAADGIVYVLASDDEDTAARLGRHGWELVDVELPDPPNDLTLWVRSSGEASQ